MPITKQRIKATRRRYSAEVKNEASGLSEQVGVPDAAKQLGLHESQLYARRKKVRVQVRGVWDDPALRD